MSLTKDFKGQTSKSAAAAFDVAAVVVLASVVPVSDSLSSVSSIDDSKISTYF